MAMMVRCNTCESLIFMLQREIHEKEALSLEVNKLRDHLHQLEIRKYGEELQTLKDLLATKNMQLQILTKELEAAKVPSHLPRPEEGD
jgi:regulator of replication initiation timing